MSAPAAVVEWSAVDVPPAFDVGALGREAHGERPIDSRHATVTAAAALMGGQVAVSLQATERSLASWDAERVLARIGRWADRLTQFSPDSDLSRVNRDPRQIVPLTPTLAAILDWGPLGGASHGRHRGRRLARRPAGCRRPGALGTASRSRLTGLVAGPRGPSTDVAAAARRPPSRPRWRGQGLARRPRPGATLRVRDRPGRCRWRHRPAGRARRHVVSRRRASDRARIRTSWSWPSWRTAPGRARSASPRPGRASTAGRTVSGRPTTSSTRGRAVPPSTDLTQATVIAGSARHAEALAKAAVILGTRAAVPMLERHAAAGAILVGEGGVTVLDATRAWLS